MYLSKEKRLAINEAMREARGKVTVELTDSLGGTGIKKNIMVFCELTELTTMIDELTALRDIIETETGFRF